MIGPAYPYGRFIAPRGIGLTLRNYIIMDGLYYSFLYIKETGYPNRSRRMDVLPHPTPVKALMSMCFYRDGKTRSETTDKGGSAHSPEPLRLKSMRTPRPTMRACRFHSGRIFHQAESPITTRIFLYVSIRDRVPLNLRSRTDVAQATDDRYAKVYGYVCQRLRFQQDALRTVMPFLQISPKLEKKSKRNVLTSGAASTYMFTSFEMSDDTGVLPQDPTVTTTRCASSICLIRRRTRMPT